MLSSTAAPRKITSVRNEEKGGEVSAKRERNLARYGVDDGEIDFEEGRGDDCDDDRCW